MNPVEGHQQAKRGGEVLSEEGVRREAGDEAVALGRVPNHLIEISEIQCRALQGRPTGEGIAGKREHHGTRERQRGQRHRDGPAAVSNGDSRQRAQGATVTWTMWRPVAPAGAKPRAVSACSSPFPSLARTFNNAVPACAEVHSACHTEHVIGLPYVIFAGVQVEPPSVLTSTCDIPRSAA